MLTTELRPLSELKLIDQTPEFQDPLTTDQESITSNHPIITQYY